MFYEIRRYTLRPDLREAWVDYFESVIVPFQRERGMDIVGSFVDAENPDIFVWLRRFDSEDQRKEQYAAVYQDPRWVAEIAPRVGELMLRELMVVTRVVPTPGSGLV